MQIHLSDITDSEGKIIQFSSEVELDKISFQMGKFPILDRSPVELRIANTGNKVLELSAFLVIVVWSRYLLLSHTRSIVSWI